LRGLASEIIKFRAPHLGVAKANMSIRSSGSVGSGGYDLHILEHLIQKTKEFRSKIISVESQTA
jgi:hypothetical protein